MVDAPDRIWASSVTENYGEWQTVTDGMPRPTEYIRADLVTLSDAVAERGAEPVDEASRIGDAVLDWMVKFDLIDGGNEYYAADVVAVLNDLTISDTSPPTSELEEAKLAERVKVEDVLDAASEYMKTQYGIGVLSHPTDRRRILSALEPPAPELCSMEAYNAATKAMAARMANTAILVGDGEPSIDGEHTDADGYPYAFDAQEGQQPVTEAMVEALKEARSVIYDTQQSCLYDDDDGQVGVTEDAVISPYHFQKICNSLKVIDEALKAAMEAGR